MVSVRVVAVLTGAALVLSACAGGAGSDGAAGSGAAEDEGAADGVGDGAAGDGDGEDGGAVPSDGAGDVSVLATTPIPASVNQPVPIDLCDHVTPAEVEAAAGMPVDTSTSVPWSCGGWEISDDPRSTATAAGLEVVSSPVKLAGYPCATSQEFEWGEVVTISDGCYREVDGSPPQNPVEGDYRRYRASLRVDGFAFETFAPTLDGAVALATAAGPRLSGTLPPRDVCDTWSSEELSTYLGVEVGEPVANLHTIDDAGTVQVGCRWAGPESSVSLRAGSHAFVGEDALPVEGLPIPALRHPAGFAWTVLDGPNVTMQLDYSAPTVLVLTEGYPEEERWRGLVENLAPRIP